MTEWDNLEHAIFESEGEAYEEGFPHSALDYLRLVQAEVPDQLLVSLAEVLQACPPLTGTVIPLYARALSNEERGVLAYFFPQAAPYLHDNQRAQLPWGRLRAWQIRLSISRN